jgi:hypothetical protein
MPAAAAGVNRSRQLGQQMWVITDPFHRRLETSTVLAANSTIGRSRCEIGELAHVTHITEITMVGGERYRVEGEAKQVERMILDAARGSIMELAWMTEAETGESIGLNPECVVMLRAIV